MRALIPVFFRAPMGGLQEHVRSQATGLRDRGIDPVVVCPSGRFSDSLEEDGMAVVRSDFTDIELDARKILTTVDPDLVHFHPFASRVLGLRMAEIAGCPAVATIHGLYEDGIAGWIENADQVVAVSKGVRDFLVSRVEAARGKVLVIANGVDIERFSYRDRTLPTDCLDVLVAGRFDQDTVVLVEMLIDTWTRQLANRQFDVRWQMAGSGTRLHELEALANQLNTEAGDTVVTWHGWLDQDALSRLQDKVGLSVSAGRNALEAMATGLPTIAVGARAYYGPTWMGRTDGMAWNWGNVHTGGYEPRSLHRDIETVLHLPVERRERIGRASRGFVEAFHSQEDVDNRLAALYRMHLAAGR